MLLPPPQSRTFFADCIPIAAPYSMPLYEYVLLYCCCMIALEGPGICLYSKDGVLLARPTYVLIIYQGSMHVQ